MSYSTGATVSIILLILIILLLVLIAIGYIVQSSLIFVDSTSSRCISLSAGESKSLLTLRADEKLDKIVGRPTSTGTLTFIFNDGVDSSSTEVQVEEGKTFAVDRVFRSGLILNRTEVQMIADTNLRVNIGLYISRIHI